MPIARRDLLSLGLGFVTSTQFPRPAAAEENGEILVAYYGALINVGPVAVAQELGEYAKAGVNVTGVVNSIGGGTAIRNMVGGGISYGIVGTSAALAAIREGIDVKIVHGVIRTVQDLFWVTRRDSPVNSIHDLVGRKIAITQPKSVSETMVNWMLELEGLSGKAELVALGSVGAGLSALENGGVDAALILEPLYSARRDRYKVAFTLDKLPPMMQMVGVATGELIKTNPDRVRGAIKAWRAAVDYTYANPEEAGKIISKYYGEKTLPPAVATTAVKNMAAIKYWSHAEIELEAMRQWIKGMERQGEWQGEPDFKKIIDLSMLPPDMRT